ISDLLAGDTLAFKDDGHGGTDLKVVQALTLTASPANGLEGSAIALSLPQAPGETLDSVTISGIPKGATLTDAKHDTLVVGNDGSITLTADKLAGLSITP